MNQKEFQGKNLNTLAAGLVLVSILLLIITVPSVLQDTSEDARPASAAAGTAVFMILHMVVLYGFWKAIRANKQVRQADKGLNIGLGILLLIFGLVIMDGAFAFTDHMLFVSVFLFIIVFCDFVAAIITFAGLFIKPRNKKADLY